MALNSLNYVIAYELQEDGFFLLLENLIFIFVFCVVMGYVIFMFVKSRRDYRETKDLKEDNDEVKGVKVQNRKDYRFSIVLLVGMVIFIGYYGVTRYDRTYLRYRHFRKAYQEKEYRTVEGKVEKLVNEDVHNPDILSLDDDFMQDTFQVNDVTFVVKGIDPYGYHEVSSDKEFGQIQKNGQQVRIVYIHDEGQKRNVIVRLEVLKKDYIE